MIILNASSTALPDSVSRRVRDSWGRLVLEVR